MASASWPDVLLEAVAACIRNGYELKLILVGDGRYRAQLERQAASLGLQQQVTFQGQVPAGAAVRELLDAAALFVLPSRTEGLPRALIEALARGLPCIGSAVGGIPELLEPDDMAPPAIAGRWPARLPRCWPILPAARPCRCAAWPVPPTTRRRCYASACSTFIATSAM